MFALLLPGWLVTRLSLGCPHPNWLLPTLRLQNQTSNTAPSQVNSKQKAKQKSESTKNRFR